MRNRPTRMACSVCSRRARLRADVAFIDDELEATWGRLLELRAAVNKALEEARQATTIRHSLDARVRLAPVDPSTPSGQQWAALLARYQEELATLCIVSQVGVESSADGMMPSSLVAALAIHVSPALGAKCARCWNYQTSVGVAGAHPDICERCRTVVNN